MFINFFFLFNKTLHKLVKQTTIDSYKAKAVGEVVDEYLKELQTKIKKKFSDIKARNEKDSLVILKCSIEI